MLNKVIKLYKQTQRQCGALLVLLVLETNLV